MPTPDMFELDTSEIKVLAKFLKEAPKQFQFAHGKVLNQLGFHLRKEMIKEIKSSLTIRNPKFIDASFRVQPTRLGKSIDQQQVEVGSIAKKGSTGWKEQQLGTRTKKKHAETPDARGGSFKGKIKGKARLRKGKAFRTGSHYQGKAHWQKVHAMMREMSGPLSGTPFILRRKTDKLNAGLYIFEGNKLRMLRSFNKAKQPPRLDWSGRALDATKRNFDFRKAIFAEATKQLPYLRRTK